jgi:DNA-binding GntR family transcriptional regulator
MLIKVSRTPATRGEEVYDVVRSQLLNGVLRPGQKLRMVELAGRFGVSQSVVREALTRLGERGLVVASPQRGFRVRELSVADIAELTELRVEIETVALRLAIERGDIQWETGVITAFHILERTPAADAEWAARHSDFHHALIAGCKNLRLQGVVQGLRDSAELYRQWYQALAGDHHRDLPAEHRELKELALARDAGAAIEALNLHITRTPRQLVAYGLRHGLGDFNGPPSSAE